MPVRSIGLAAVTLQGFIDAIERGIVYGWAWNPQRPGERVAVEILHGGTALGTATADLYRDDLVELEIGDGRHAFQFDTAGSLPDGVTGAEIEVRFAGSTVPLPRMQVRPQLRPRTDAKPRPEEVIIAALQERIAGQEQVIADMSNLMRGLVERYRGGTASDPRLDGDIAGLVEAVEKHGQTLSSIEVYLTTFGRSLRDLSEALPRDGQRRGRATAGFRVMDAIFLLLLGFSVLGFAVAYGVPW